MNDLAREVNKPMFEGSFRAIARRAGSANNLREMGHAVFDYGEANRHLPPGGTLNQFGEPQHSWETMLLPYLDCEGTAPDMTLPWDHPRNAEQFSRVLSVFLHPALAGPERQRPGMPTASP